MSNDSIIYNSVFPISVSIYSTSGHQFKGFMLQVLPIFYATKSKKDLTRGHFLPTDNLLVKSCYHNNDSVTHKDTTEKQGLELYWKAPADLHEVVVIRYETIKTLSVTVQGSPNGTIGLQHLYHWYQWHFHFQFLYQWYHWRTMNTRTVSFPIRTYLKNAPLHFWETSLFDTHVSPITCINKT